MGGKERTHNSNFAEEKKNLVLKILRKHFRQKAKVFKRHKGVVQHAWSSFSLFSLFLHSTYIAFLICNFVFFGINICNFVMFSCEVKTGSQMQPVTHQRPS